MREAFVCFCLGDSLSSTLRWFDEKLRNFSASRCSWKMEFNKKRVLKAKLLAAYEYESLLNGQVKRWHERTHRVNQRTSRASVPSRTTNRLCVILCFINVSTHGCAVGKCNICKTPVFVPLTCAEEEESNAFCVRIIAIMSLPTFAVVRCENVLRNSLICLGKTNSAFVEMNRRRRAAWRKKEWKVNLVSYSVKRGTSSPLEMFVKTS